MLEWGLEESTGVTVCFHVAPRGLEKGLLLSVQFDSLELSSLGLGPKTGDQ